MEYLEEFLVDMIKKKTLHSNMKFSKSEKKHDWKKEETVSAMSGCEYI